MAVVKARLHRPPWGDILDKPHLLSQIIKIITKQMNNATGEKEKKSDEKFVKEVKFPPNQIGSGLHESKLPLVQLTYWVSLGG